MPMIKAFIPENALTPQAGQLPSSDETCLAIKREIWDSTSKCARGPRGHLLAAQMSSSAEYSRLHSGTGLSPSFSCRKGISRQTAPLAREVVARVQTDESSPSREAGS